MATEKDVQLSASNGQTTNKDSTATGTWSPPQGGPTIKSYAELTVDGEKVAYEAKATFSYSGTAPDPPPAGNTKKVDDSETVTLKAKTTLLKPGKDEEPKKVLVNEDSEKGPNGNEIRIVSSRRLKTE